MKKQQNKVEDKKRQDKTLVPLHHPKRQSEPGRQGQKNSRYNATPEQKSGEKHAADFGLSYEFFGVHKVSNSLFMLFLSFRIQRVHDVEYMKMDCAFADVQNHEDLLPSFS
jgi:hypothetical protein